MDLRDSELVNDQVNCVGLLKKPDGTYTTDRKDTLRTLLQVHFPGSSCNTTYEYSDTTDHRVHVNSRVKSLSGKIFSKDMIKWAVKTFEPFKAPGGDGLFPALLQKSIDLILPELTALFRASYTRGYIHNPWRKVNVVSIPKAGNRPTPLLRVSKKKLINDTYQQN